MIKWSQITESIIVKMETRFDYPGPYSARKTRRLLKKARSFRRFIKTQERVDKLFVKRLKKQIFAKTVNASAFCKEQENTEVR